MDLYTSLQRALVGGAGWLYILFKEDRLLLDVRVRIAAHSHRN